MKYLITVQQMATDPKEGMDFVAGWSGVIDEEDLGKVQLNLIGELLEEATRDRPPSMRAMTDQEIRDWRADRRPHVTLNHGALG